VLKVLPRKHTESEKHIREAERVGGNKRVYETGLRRATYDKTLEKSADGDITKLSALADHDIKC
jgi:hypothetical protein